MCNDTGMAFGERQLTAGDAADRAVLEVGARHVQEPPMSLRAHVMAMRPSSYVGVDLAAGPGVDVVCPAEQLVERFGANSFDLVICTEMLEHVDDWRCVIRNLKQVLRPRGVLLRQGPGQRLSGRKRESRRESWR